MDEIFEYAQLPGAILEWYDNYFAVTYEDPDAPPAETRYPETNEGDSTTNATEPEETKPVPTYIEEVRKPRNLPDGVWEDVVMQTKTVVNVDYYFGDEYLLSFTQRVLKSNDKKFDNDGAEVTHIKINESDATVVEYANKEETYVIWSDGEYMYYIISTDCNIEMLIQYAENVK